jgi:hypothetical protein
MKIILSTIASAIVLFLLSSIFYMSVVNHFASFETYKQLWRGPEDMKFWTIIIGNLLQGFFLSILYWKYYKGESPAAEGFTFGLIVGLLFSVPYIFFMWGTFLVRYKAVIMDGASMGFRILIASIVIALIFGKKKAT